MWDTMVVESIKECIGNYTVAFSSKNVEDGFIWPFVGVCGPNVDNNRKDLWDELVGLGSWWNLP